MIDTDQSFRFKLLTLFMCNAHGMPTLTIKIKNLQAFLPYRQMIGKSVRRKPCGGGADGNVKSILTPVHLHRIHTVFNHPDCMTLDPD